MKIALCLSGYPRFYDRLDTNDYGDCDVYIHSWFDKTGNIEKESCAGSFTSSNKFLEYVANNNVIRYFNPSNHLFESYKSKYEEFLSHYSKFRNCEGETRKSVFPMFYSLKKSIELALQSGITYDIIVRSRFDLKLEQKISYVVDSNIHIPDQFHFFGLNDQFAYGSPKVMETYSKVYDYLSIHPDIQLNPETILKRYLYDKKIKVDLTEDWFYLLR